VRHANEADLDCLEGLLTHLRALPQLRERRRGSFSRGSKAFLHFHAEGDDCYVDARLYEDFERYRVTTPAEWADFMAKVTKALDSPT
jgi:hypothetical protein